MKAKKNNLIQTYLKEFKKDFRFWNIYIDIDDVFTNEKNNFKNDLWFLFINFMWNIEWKTSNNYETLPDYLFDFYK